MSATAELGVRQCRLVLPSVEPELLSTIRELVTVLLILWRHTACTFAATMSVTELLTNVHKHTGQGCELMLLDEEDGIALCVTDPDDRFPVIRLPDDMDESGRGLQIVAAIVDGLTVVPLSRGKRVCIRINGQGKADDDRG